MFVIDGVVDFKWWVYILVCVFYNRLSIVDGKDFIIYVNSLREIFKEFCYGLNFGVFKVFIFLNGLDYVGVYNEFVIVDER